MNGPLESMEVGFSMNWKNKFGQGGPSCHPVRFLRLVTSIRSKTTQTAKNVLSKTLSQPLPSARIKP